jgi:hypothetical protein
MDRVTPFPSTPSALFPPRAAWFCSKSFLPVLLAFAAFVIDVKTPNGMMDGLLYISDVLICVWVPAAHVALYTALGLTIPMILGFVLSPIGASMEVAVVNRCVAFGMIWLAAIAVWRNARKRDSTLAALQQQLRGVERAAEEERMALSDVAGSNPVTPTNKINSLAAFLSWQLRVEDPRKRTASALGSISRLLPGRFLPRLPPQQHVRVD